MRSCQSGPSGCSRLSPRLAYEAVAALPPNAAVNAAARSVAGRAWRYRLVVVSWECPMASLMLTKIDAAGDEQRSEGMAQVVPAQRPQAGGVASVLVAAAEGRAIEGTAEGVTDVESRSPGAAPHGACGLCRREEYWATGRGAPVASKKGVTNHLTRSADSASFSLTQNHKTPAKRHLRKQPEASHNPRVAGRNDAPEATSATSTCSLVWRQPHERSANSTRRPRSMSRRAGSSMNRRSSAPSGEVMSRTLCLA